MAKQKRSKVSIDKEQYIFKIRHSASHILAHAIQNIYKDVKFGIGPAIDDGYYYDFEFPKEVKISENDLEKIEQEMNRLIKQKLLFKQSFKPIDKAVKYYKDKNQPYKAELAKDLKENGEDKLSFYESGDFIDLCSGPHIENSSEIGAIKLLSVAGAYWKGDEKNNMLVRIYGCAFPLKEELNEYLRVYNEAKKRDHRKLGKDMELFIIDDEVGPGLVLWLPNGAYIRHKAQEFALNTYLERGYQLVATPHFASEKLWSHSGHLDFYKESMYNSFGIEDYQYRMKPMNCPLHVTMYNSRPRSYRELPIRWTEMGTVYRFEKSGVLHGLTRVRGFTQDDAHIICTPDQLHKELVEALNLTLFILGSFGFKDFELNLSVRDPKNKEKFIGSDEGWDMAEKALIDAMKEVSYKDYVLDVGGAVFYGPKIDFKLFDSIGRKWQLSTIQFDFNLPSRFNMKYMGDDGSEHVPFMIHRALLGSLERFMGIFIEHTGGNFPVWMVPIQVKILPVKENHLGYAKEIIEQLKQNGIRAEIDDKEISLSEKIKLAQKNKIPYMLIVGDKEIESKKISVRSRAGDIQVVSLEDFLIQLKEDIQKKR